MVHVVFDDAEKGALKLALAQQGAIYFDIIKLNVASDIGNINCAPVSTERKKLVLKLFCADAWDAQAELNEEVRLYWEKCVWDHYRFIAGAESGESFQLWYSDAPFSKCGLYSSIHELANYECPVSVVKFPEYNTGITSITGWWGEVSQEKWLDFLPLATKLSRNEITITSNYWNKIKQENTPLRSVINGNVYSVSADFYDSFIRSKMGNEPFKVAALILRVLNEYRFGIGDGWVAYRIKDMISTGELVIHKKDFRFYDSILMRH